MRIRYWSSDVCSSDLHGFVLLRQAPHLEAVDLEVQVVFADLQQVRGDLLRLGADLATDPRGGSAGHRGRAGAVGAEAVGGGVSSEERRAGKEVVCTC